MIVLEGLVVGSVLHPIYEASWLTKSVLGLESSNGRYPYARLD